MGNEQRNLSNKNYFSKSPRQDPGINAGRLCANTIGFIGLGNLGRAIAARLLGQNVPYLLSACFLVEIFKGK